MMYLLEGRGKKLNFSIQVAIDHLGFFNTEIKEKKFSYRNLEFDGRLIVGNLRFKRFIRDFP